MMHYLRLTKDYMLSSLCLSLIEGGGVKVYSQGISDACLAPDEKFQQGMAYEPL
jgi:hypothetical protein